VSSLDAWRREQGLDRIVLCGHSLGGYLSACYAMRHPQHVQHLILMCPAGVGRKPADWQPPSSLRDPWTLRGQLFRWVPGCLHRVGGGGPWSST
jgi:pimeloyl-ACP methyl ester carboxylesterase